MTGTRTGLPEFDRVIEEFLREPCGDWTADDSPISALADPTLAHGMCQMVSEQFAAFATERGFKVYSTDTDLEELGYTITGEAHGEVLDADGEIVTGHYHEHTVASYYPDGQCWPYVVDFTASQYGYTEFPLVTT